MYIMSILPWIQLNACGPNGEVIVILTQCYVDIHVSLFRHIRYDTCRQLLTGVFNIRPGIG